MDTNKRKSPPNILLLALLAAVSLGGCKEDEPPAYRGPQADRPAPEASWTKVGASHVLEMKDRAMKVKLFCCMREQRGHMQVSFDVFEKGTKVSVAGTEWEQPQGEHTTRFFVDIRDSVAELALESVKAELFQAPVAEADVAIPVTVKMPGFEKVETELKTKLKVAGLLYQLMKQVEDGPVSFAGEAKDDPIDAAIALWDGTSEVFTLHRAGAAKVLRDVDWVAITTWEKSDKTRTCGGYGRMGDVTSSSIEFVLGNTRLDVYDRRTGKKIGKKVFSPGPCPKAVTRNGGDKPGIGASREVMAKWLDAQVKAGKLGG